MIRLFVGENIFEANQALHRLRSDFLDNVESIDGGETTANQLLDLLIGMSLFSSSRLLVIYGLSEQKDLWDKLPDLAGRMNDDTELVLVEPTVDKRTRTYKWLKKHAQVSVFAPFGEREGARVAAWATRRAKDQHGFVLSVSLANKIVERIGHDQLRLDRTLEQLSLAETIDKDLIDRVVPLPRTENVFELFEAALRGERSRVHDIIAYLELTLGLDGAYQTLGLLVSQLVPLNALVFGGAPGDIAKDFSTHPFVVQKLGAYARQLSASQVRQMNEALGRADMAMKTTSASPWLLLEAALVEVGVIAQ